MAQSSSVLRPGHPGRADSRHSLPRALGSPVPPKPSAKPMDLTGEGIKKAERRPSGESRLVCKVGTDYCMHPPWGRAPRDQSFLPRVRPGKRQVLLSKTPPNCAMQPPVQGCWSMQTPWASTAQQTQGKQAIHPDGGQYKSQVQRSHLRRKITIAQSCCKLKPDSERTLPGVHTSTSFSVQLQYLSAHVPRTPLPAEQ